MKKKVYVFDEYVSSQKNGIGSFLGEFLYCMKQLDVDICVLIFNANVEEFSIQKEEGVEKMLFPPFLFGDFTKHAEIVDKFFRLYILDSSRNVFFINLCKLVNLYLLCFFNHKQAYIINTAQCSVPPLSERFFSILDIIFGMIDFLYLYSMIYYTCQKNNLFSITVF